jgi:pimeloyl-ACP methyl ester carboxylesterase
MTHIKTQRSLILLVIIAFWALPSYSEADFVVPPFHQSTFESLQNLAFKAQAFPADVSTTTLTDQATISLPIGVPVPISYSFSHLPNWPNRSATPEVNDSLFADTLAGNKLYLEEWEGTPFTDAAHLIKSWNIDTKPAGQVTMTFPEAGSYFIIAYFPDGFYIDPQSFCSDNPDWQTECEPPTTLDQVENYFTTSLTSESSVPFPYIPDAYGGTQFTIPAAVQKTLPASNVLFIPGIEGSRLYMRTGNIEQSVWEPSLIANITNLAMNPDGTSQQKLYTRDLVDYAYGIKALGDVYGPFEDFLTGLVSKGTITAWKPFPYDWRYDVEDIVKNGTLVGQPTGPIQRVYLQDMLQELASTSPSGKVTIVAHSNGGLLAKALAVELQKENKLSLIDRIIYVGSPQLGTPLTIGSLLNGDGQTDVTGGLLMYGGTVRIVAATMPGMYGLLPAAAYFTHDLDAPVTFANDVKDLFTKPYGSAITTLSSLVSFLTDSAGLTKKFSPNDLQSPLALSNKILTKESQMHADLDAWTPPSLLTEIAISGWGNPTPFQYSYDTSDQKVLSCFRAAVLSVNCAFAYRVSHVAKNTDSGDGTVVSSSAIAAVPLSFYFNAKLYSADGLGKIAHGNLTSASPIQLLIGNALTAASSSQLAIASKYVTSSIPIGGDTPLNVVSIHSPMNIIAEDAEGNQTGIFPIAGKPGIYIEKENIPGSTLQVLDDEKYLYLPQDQTYSISLQGYDDGLSTIDLGTMGSNGITSTAEEFAEVPTTASTTASFVLPPSAPIPEIQVDIFGDGSTTPLMPTSATSSASSTDGELKPREILHVIRKRIKQLSLDQHTKKVLLQGVTEIRSVVHTPQSQTAITDLEKAIVNLIPAEITDTQGNFLVLLLEEMKASK